MNLEAILLQFGGYVVSGVLGYLLGKKQRADEASEIKKAHQERLTKMAPLIVEELKEIYDLCNLFRSDWNTFFRGTVLVKRFPLSRVNLENDDLSRWSLEHDGQFHNIVRLVSEINLYLEKAQGKYISEPRARVDVLRAIIRGLPDPFRVIDPSNFLQAQ